jgi:hypothetical protein
MSDEPNDFDPQMIDELIDELGVGAAMVTTFQTSGGGGAGGAGDAGGAGGGDVAASAELGLLVRSTSSRLPAINNNPQLGSVAQPLSHDAGVDPAMRIADETQLDKKRQKAPAAHDAGIDYGVLAADIAADNMAAHIAAEAEKEADTQCRAATYNERMARARESSKKTGSAGAHA